MNSETKAAIEEKKPRSRIHRLLNYKRYIDWLIEKELTDANKRRTRKSDKRRTMPDRSKPARS